MELTDYKFFQDLETESAQKVESEAKPVALPVGSFLYYEGDVCEGILFLRKGRVKVYLCPENVSSSEITLYYISPGEQCLVNTFSTISKSPTQANAVVDESIEGWLLSEGTINWLLDHSPAYREYKLTYCSQRLGEVMGLVSELRFKRMDERLLNWLYVQGRDTIHATHEQIANILGTSREVVSRLLKNFEKEGRVQLGRGMIRILSTGRANGTIS